MYGIDLNFQILVVVMYSCNLSSDTHFLCMRNKDAPVKGPDIVRGLSAGQQVFYIGVFLSEHTRKGNSL